MEKGKIRRNKKIIKDKVKKNTQDKENKTRKQD